jgi:hypothetical protein
MGKSSVVVKRSHSQEQSFLQQQWNKSHKMTLWQFLSVLRYTIALEDIMLRFDYIAFYLQCLDFLHSLRTAVDSDMRKYNGDIYIEDETQLPFIVRYIFQVVTTNTALMTNLGGREMQNLNIQSKMMVKATAVLREFIQREAHVETNKLNKVCVCWCEATKA